MCWDLEKKYGTMPNFHLIIQLDVVKLYIKECAKISWDLVVQKPPMLLNFSESEYISELHTRFHNADKTSTVVICYLWPILTEQSSGTVLQKGVVIT